MTDTIDTLEINDNPKQKPFRTKLAHRLAVELYCLNAVREDFPDDLKLIKSHEERVAKCQQELSDPSNWVEQFRSVGQLEDGDVRMILDGFLPEGINMIGGLAGQGKTLFALSLAKSLTTGEPFLGRYKPAEVIPIVYLIPESSSRAFKMRCKAFRIPDDPQRFICRTVTEGSTLMLDDMMLLEAVKHLKPVVILDTLPRFNEAQDENDAASNKKLVNDMTALRALGAIAVIGLHHSTKASSETEMTLQNTLRGNSDLGAMADSVYGLRQDQNTYNKGAGPNEIEVQCVKARDIKNPPQPFKIAATYKNNEGQIVSHIDESGDFQVIDQADVVAAQDQDFVTLVMADPKISRDDLAKELGTTQYSIRARSKRLGFVRTAGRFGKWIHQSEIELNRELSAAQPTRKGE